MSPDIDPLRRGKDKRVVIGCAQTQKEARSGRNELACHLNFFLRRAVQHLDRTVVTQTRLQCPKDSAMHAGLCAQ